MEKIFELRKHWLIYRKKSARDANLKVHIKPTEKETAEVFSVQLQKLYLKK